MVAAALSAAALPVELEPGTVVLELAPKVDELPAAVDGGPPIAVVPVEGVVLPRLPGVVGPASVLEVAPPGEPMLFVLATLPEVEPGVVVVEGRVPLLPSVLEPVVDELLVPVPQGAPSGAPGLVVCATAAPAQAANATHAALRAKAFMFSSP